MYIEGIIVYVCVQFFPGDSKLHLDWLRNMAEMKIQKATEDPSPTKIEPLVALLNELGTCIYQALPVSL